MDETLAENYSEGDEMKNNRETHKVILDGRYIGAITNNPLTYRPKDWNQLDPLPTFLTLDACQAYIEQNYDSYEGGFTLGSRTSTGLMMKELKCSEHPDATFSFCYSSGYSYCKECRWEINSRWNSPNDIKNQLIFYWVKDNSPAVIPTGYSGSNKMALPTAQRLLPASDLDKLMAYLGTEEVKKLLEAAELARPRKNITLTPEGKAYRDRHAPISHRRKGGLSDEEREAMEKYGLTRADIVRGRKAATANNNLMWNRLASQNGGDPYWKANGLDMKVGELVLTDNGITRLKPVTGRMLPGAAGGQYTEENTRTIFQLTNHWMETWMKKNKQAITDDILTAVVGDFLRTRKVTRPTPEKVKAFWAEQDRLDLADRERILAELGGTNA